MTYYPRIVMNTHFTSPQKSVSKGKLLAVLAGLLSLAISAVAIPTALAQAGAAGPGRRPDLSELNLTEEQQAQIDSIRATERQQMDAILTADQKARLETARTNQENPRQVFETLNLTDDQRAQMRTIHASAREQMDATLTAEQRQQLAQHRPPLGEGRGPGLSELNLTAEQQAQIDRIHESAKTQMAAILTADQRTQLETARANQENPHQAFESLNLTDDQKAQLRSIHESTREQVDAVLTAEQRQQLEQHRPQPPEGEQPPQ